MTHVTPAVFVYRTHEFLSVFVQTKLGPGPQTPDARSVDATQQPVVGRENDEEQRARNAAGERLSGHAVGDRIISGHIRHDRRQEHFAVLVRSVLLRAHHVRHWTASKCRAISPIANWTPTTIMVVGRRECYSGPDNEVGRQ